MNSQTKLSDMAMQIKVSEMKLARMKVELRNEQYLDSLGGAAGVSASGSYTCNTFLLEAEERREESL